MKAKTSAKTIVKKQEQGRNGTNGTTNHVHAVLPAGLTKEQILQDYRLAFESRQASLLGRREVLSGKAKFGIFGDGKEIAQIALAHSFHKGDWRSGYYRDQTLMFALGIMTIQQFFAQLYAHTDLEAEPASVGRQMNGHFANRTLNEDGTWKNVMTMNNSSADVSPTGSQMPRLVGLAYASRLYRELPELQHMTTFSQKGNEIAWGTIGNASCAEGMFWESLNAIGVLKSPAVISIWDDGYGISVPNEFQMTKGNLSELLRGFEAKEGGAGFQLLTVKGWDYPALVEVYARASEITRTTHQPAIVHVIEVTQPQGHSTSGSHERYKSPERLEWEKEFDGLAKMRTWMLQEHIATAEQLDALEEEGKKSVADWKQKAWDAYMAPIKEEISEVSGIMDELASSSVHAAELQNIKQELTALREPFRKDSMVAVHRALIAVRDEDTSARKKLILWRDEQEKLQKERYSSFLTSESPDAAQNVESVAPVYFDDAHYVTGFQVLNACFDAALARDPRVSIFGEDVGKLGDVNQGCAGLQEKYGPLRVSDTGIRECTILGQAIGMAMRGLRPIAEIQYLDYLLYALQIMSDDLATVRWRTKGGQKAPVIVRTRGHRLEGVWHSGSPMAGIIHLVRGVHVLVPRDMTRAAGFYNTLLRADEPALVVEVLNGYRLREQMPSNIADFTLPLGVPDVLRSGRDVTLVTYGASCRVALEAAKMLEQVNVDVEIIDVQSLLPFDLHGKIVESLKKTNRILFFDEDVPGGATAYMMQEVLENQNGYQWLDSEPRTLTAQAHRPAYGTDGNYWSKPEAEHVFTAVYDIMHEANPQKYPMFYR